MKRAVGRCWEELCLKLQAQLFEKNSPCSECGQKILRLEDAQVDHILPFAEGGRTEPLNAQLLHSWCNRKKSNRMPIDTSSSNSHHQRNVNGNGVRYNVPCCPLTSVVHAHASCMFVKTCCCIQCTTVGMRCMKGASKLIAPQYGCWCAKQNSKMCF